MPEKIIDHKKEFIFLFILITYIVLVSLLFHYNPKEIILKTQENKIIIDEQKIKWIQKAIENMPDKGLAEIIAALDNAVSYDELRAVKKCWQQPNSEK